MISINSNDLVQWLLNLVIPLTRILGFISIAPAFGNQAIPPLIKLAFGLLITIVIFPTLPNVPLIDILSLTGFLMIAEQMIIGLALGLALQVIFAAVEMAGQLGGLTMGFGFASFFDPLTQGSTEVISQFFAVITILFFLSIDGHLMLISALVESFHSFPIQADSFNLNGMTIALWGAKIFSIGLQISLPIVAILLITNMALGVLTKAAPQLQIFGIGFPITLGVGLLVVALMMPSLGVPLKHILEEGILAMKLR